MSELHVSLQPITWLAAFWVAVACYTAQERKEGVRFVVGLGLGAVCAYLGALVFQSGGAGGALIERAAVGGFSVLFVPCGVFLAAAGLGSAERARFLDAGMGALPLALATARLGCVAAECCYGKVSELPWALELGPGSLSRHPSALYEIGGMLVIAAAVYRGQSGLRAGLFLALFGGLRLVLESFRAGGASGDPGASPETVAAGWLMVGMAILAAHSTSAALGSPGGAGGSWGGDGHGGAAGRALPVGRDSGGAVERGQWDRGGVRRSSLRFGARAAVRGARAGGTAR